MPARPVPSDVASINFEAFLKLHFSCITWWSPPFSWCGLRVKITMISTAAKMRRPSSMLISMAAVAQETPLSTISGRHLNIEELQWQFSTPILTNPLTTDMGIPLDKSELLSLFLETFLYGEQLFSSSIYMAQNWRTTIRNFLDTIFNHSTGTFSERHFRPYAASYVDTYRRLHAPACDRCKCWLNRSPKFLSNPSCL